MMLYYSVPCTASPQHSIESRHRSQVFSAMDILLLVFSSREEKDLKRKKKKKEKLHVFKWTRSVMTSSEGPLARAVSRETQEVSGRQHKNRDPAFQSGESLRVCARLIAML